MFLNFSGQEFNTFRSKSPIVHASHVVFSQIFCFVLFGLDFKSFNLLSFQMSF